MRQRLRLSLVIIIAALGATPLYAQGIALDLEWVRLGDSTGEAGQENGTASVESAEFSPDGSLIISGAKRGGDLVLWTSEGEELWRRYHAGEAEVEVVAFTRDGNHVVSGGEDGYLRAWRVADGQQVWNYTTGGGGSQVSFDGMRFSHTGDRLAGGDEQGQLMLFDTSDPDPANWPRTPIVTVFQGDDDDRPGGGSGDSDINSVDWTADDRFIVTAGRDATVKRWEVAALAPPQGGLVQTYTGFQSSIKSVRLSPDAQYVAAGGQDSPDGLVLVWDYDTAEIVERIDYPTFDKIEAVEWTPNGQFLLTGGVEGAEGRRDLDGNPYPGNGGFGNIRAYDRASGFANVLEEETYRQEYFHFDADGDRLVSSHEDGTLRLWNVTYGVAGEQAPFGGSPAAIPGTIQAEAYDLGGPGLAYQDGDAANNGGAFRPDDAVDIQATTDTGGGHNVGWIRTGEWLEYTVDVAQAGTYDLALRVASRSNGGQLHVSFDGVDVTGSVAFGATGGWQAWTTVTVEDVALAAGEQVMRITMEEDLFNLNYVTFTQEGGTAVTVTATVGGSADDAEEGSSVDLTSGDLDFGQQPYSAVRFALDVPAGATVQTAHIQFTADENGQSGTTDLTLRAEASDDAADFAVQPISGRPLTAATVAWSPAAWNAAGARGGAQRTPDLAALVQAVVDRAGWQQGNHVAFVVEGSGKRSARTVDGGAAAELVVTYAGGTAASLNQALQPDPLVADEGVFPGHARLEGAYPNPFNPSTNVVFNLDAPTLVSLHVYDLLGRRVRTLADKAFSAGRYEVPFRADALPGGVYFIRFRADGATETTKVLLLK